MKTKDEIPEKSVETMSSNLTATNASFEHFKIAKNLQAKKMSKNLQIIVPKMQRRPSEKIQAGASKARSKSLMGTRKFRASYVSQKNKYGFASIVVLTVDYSDSNFEISPTSYMLDSPLRINKRK